MPIDEQTLPSDICKLTPNKPTYELALTDPSWKAFLVGAQKTIYAIGAKPDLAGTADEILMFSTEINVGEAGTYNFFVTGDDYYVFFIDCIRIISSNPTIGPGKKVDVTLQKGVHKFFALVQNNSDETPIWFGLTIYKDGEFLYEARRTGWLVQTYTPDLLDAYRKELEKTTTPAPTRPASTTPAPQNSGSSCADLLFGGDFKITPSTTTTTTTTTTTKKPTEAPTPAPTQKPTPKKVCNQNPTGAVYETLLQKGSAFPGHKKVLEWDYYAIHVQPDISKAVGNRMYLMRAFVEIPTAGTYLFDFFSDDDHEVYLNCTMFSQGPFGYYSKNATLPAGKVEFIMRYKNIPNLTHGYIAFNIWSGATMVYQARASHFKGQENVIGEINWTDE